MPVKIVFKGVKNIIIVIFYVTKLANAVWNCLQHVTSYIRAVVALWWQGPIDHHDWPILTAVLFEIIGVAPDNAKKCLYQNTLQIITKALDSQKLSTFLLRPLVSSSLVFILHRSLSVLVCWWTRYLVSAYGYCGQVHIEYKLSTSSTWRVLTGGGTCYTFSSGA